MNILIRAIGVSGELPTDWYRVPNTEGVWVYELQSDSIGCLGEEIIAISNKLRMVANQSVSLVLHFGKYCDVTSLSMDSNLIDIIHRLRLEVEVY